MLIGAWQDEPKVGTVHTSIRFALLPTRMSDGSLVWLERYRSSRELVMIGGDFTTGATVHCWDVTNTRLRGSSGEEGSNG